jgi:hypothetical protein
MATNKNRFLANVTASLFLFFGLAGNAQDYSDKEIGFEREKLRSEITINKRFVNPKFIESYLDTLRSRAVLRYRLGKNEFIESQKITSKEQTVLEAQRYAGCESFTFSGANPFINWILTNNIAPFNTNVFEQHSGVGGQSFLNDLGGNRFQALQSGYNDPHLGNVPASVMRIGNAGDTYRREMISRNFVVNSAEDFLVYDFAIVLEDPNHAGRPFYSVVLRAANGDVIDCSRVNYEAIPGIPGFHPSPAANDVWFRPWATNIIKPVDFGVQIGESVTIEVSVADCTGGAHFGYGYFDIKCLTEDQIIKVRGNQCLENPVEFTTILDQTNTFEWSIKDQDGNLLSLPNPAAPQFTYSFSQAGTYTVELSVRYFTTDDPNLCRIVSVFQKVITIAEKCNDCIDCTSFNLLKGEKYLVSGWVRESDAEGGSDGEQYKNYTNAFISVSFFDIGGSLISQPSAFYASGDVIEGWQRIVGEFVVPQNIEDIQIDLQNSDKSKMAYFDDIRVFPTKGNMKSFVYDKTTQRLMAELDENNYGTYYEYDIEGGLVRIKKETERGIFTIQETRSGNAKFPQ